jgi:hypothetical protein
MELLGLLDIWDWCVIGSIIAVAIATLAILIITKGDLY